MRKHAGRFVCLVAGMVAATVHAAPPGGPNSGSTPNPPRMARGEKHALLVGVREYDPNELRPLPFAEPDAGELAAVLRDAGYQRVVLMTQAEGARRARALPLAKNIRAELKGLLEDRDANDSVLVALIGHGVQFRGGQASYFCPMDARLADKTTLIALDEVYRDLEKSGAGVKVMLVDACRNDPQSDNSRARSVVALESVNRPQAKAPPGGVAALYSCSEGEKSYEDAGIGHGIFSHFLIKGLKGEADLDGDGSVELEELAWFAKKRVPSFVKDLYGPEVRQMPVLRGEIRGLPVLLSLDRAARATEPATPRPAPPVEPPNLQAKAGMDLKSKLIAARPTGPAKVLTNSLGMRLALIPAGEFLMGSPDTDTQAFAAEKPQHRVRISRPFYLGVHEVTQGQYQKVTGQTPSGFKGSDDQPVEQVSWFDAIACCNALSLSEKLTPYYKSLPSKVGDPLVEIAGGSAYRLPTEAEWEYACRAGGTGRYSFGDDASALDAHGWSGLNSGKTTHPVGQKPANAFGLHDMHGNVWEWCWDRGEAYGTSLKVDPMGVDSGSERFLRGGCWYNDTLALRAANRLGYKPATRLPHFGFRLARDAGESP